MECPKCHEEMEEATLSFGVKNPSSLEFVKKILVCHNEECEFYGIPRLNLEEYY